VAVFVVAIGVRVAMVITIGLCTLAGAALGLRFNVLILIPTIALAMVSVAVVEVVRGDQAWSVVLMIVLVTAVIQISYLIGSITRAAIEGLISFKGRSEVAIDIQERMEVVGSDGNHVGTVDHTESTDRIVLTGDDPKAGGKPHLILIDWVDYVDSKVHLNKPSTKAVSEWQVAA
jgi:hypothetical protein